MITQTPILVPGGSDWRSAPQAAMTDPVLGSRASGMFLNSILQYCKTVTLSFCSTAKL